MPTMADVAKLAGVSLSTASYVLSGKRPISAATRNRVLVAMDELGFQPNNQGRALASGRSRTIALLYPSENSLLSPMPMEFVTAVAAQAELRGYALMLSTVNRAEDRELLILRRGFVDGYILMEVSLSDPRIDLLQRTNVPFALIGRRADNSGLHLVDLDFEHSIQIAIEHLRGLGHDSIGLLCRSNGELHDYGPTVRMRRQFDAEICQHGLTGRYYACAANPEAGTNVFKAIIRKQPGITALICSNTEAITGVIRGAIGHSVSIPNDLSIIGLLSPRLAEFLNPPITAVDFPAGEMGRRGVDFLIDQLEGRTGNPQQLVIRSTVTVRSSTRRVPG